MKKSYKEQWAAFDRGDMPTVADGAAMVRQISAALPYLQDRPAYELATRDAVLTKIKLEDNIRAKSERTSRAIWEGVVQDVRFRIVQRAEDDCVVEDFAPGGWRPVDDDEVALRVLCVAFVGSQKRRP